MLTLAISTSSGQFALVIGENNQVIANSNDEWNTSFISNELDDMLSLGLAYCKREVTEIGVIIVDIGPGGTSRVRTGIAFANALAYSLGISVCPVSSMELAGIDASNRFDGLPVVNSIKSIKGNAYIGLYNQSLISICHGTVKDIVPQLVQDIEQFVAVGFHREAIMRLPSLQNKTIIDSAMSFGHARIMIEKSDFFIKNKHGFPVYAQPITEKTLNHE